MMGTQNQLAIQMGVISPIHVANAYKRFYQMLDVPNWEELVATPEQMQQTMQAHKKNKWNKNKETSQILSD